MTIAPPNLCTTGDVDMSPALSAALTVVAECQVTGAACIRASLVVRDYLVALGFEAKVIPVAVVMRAHENGRELHSLGIGMRGHGRVVDDKGWDGHLVVIVKDHDGPLLIDASIGQARRPAWADLPAMIVTPVASTAERRKLDGAMAILLHSNRPGHELAIQWFAKPSNTAWREAPEAQPELRDAVVKDMLGAYCDMQFPRRSA